MRETTAAALEATIREYFDDCNESDAAKMMGCMEPDAIHYFPAGAPQGTFNGARAIAEGWQLAVRNFGSIWTIDRVLVDSSRLEAVIEWTHFKPKQGVHLRGDEWYIFSERGLVKEVKAYYAAPASASSPMTHEIGDFDYAGRGYPMSPPDVRRLLDA